MASERKTYWVTATRSGEWWKLRIRESSTVTRVRRLDLAEEAVRDLVADEFGADESTFDVSISVDLADEIAPAVTKAKLKRADAYFAQRRSAAANRAAAKVLSDAGFSMRDTGSLLGLSHQRVAQILEAPDEEPSVLDAFLDNDEPVTRELVERFIAQNRAEPVKFPGFIVAYSRVESALVERDGKWLYVVPKRSSDRRADDGD
jgi:hypothetical protein